MRLCRRHARRTGGSALWSGGTSGPGTGNVLAGKPPGNETKGRDRVRARHDTGDRPRSGRGRRVGRLPAATGTRTPSRQIGALSLPHWIGGQAVSDSAPGGGAASPPAIDTTVPNSARIWNYWLGGKDNYAVDRAAGDQFLATYPGIAVAARASRAFQARAVRYLAGEAGLRQFLDIGTGLPTADSTHQVARAVAPQSRIVYVDNDPVVLSHAHALLTSSPEGVTDYLDADLRDTGTIIGQAADTLDFTRPVAIMLLA